MKKVWGFRPGLVSLALTPNLGGIGTPMVTCSDEAGMIATAPVEAVSTAPAASAVRGEQVARCVLLAILYLTMALIAVHQCPGADPDIWWHMRSAEWLLQHRSFPHVDPFSRFGASQHWEAYSWLYEVIVLKLFQRFGQIGLMAYSTAMVLAITLAIHRLVARVQADFTQAMILTLACTVSLTRLFAPRPWLFSILFFILQLDLLSQARRTGRWNRLFWLVPLYAVWANIHIQFLDGLVVLGAAALEPLLLRWWFWPQTVRVSATKLCTILGLCVLATLLNPYGWQIYKVAYELTSQPGVLNEVSELLAISFRSWNDYLILGFALAPVAVLSWKRRFPLWESLLLAGGMYLSFKSRRDIWFLASVATMILAAKLPTRARELRRLPILAYPAMAIAVLAGIFVGGRVMHVTESHLQSEMGEVMPVKAVEAIRAKGLSGPLYNDYNWGGYLIWNLRMPVSIDGRAALYGDKLIDRSGDTFSGKPDWAGDPQFISARLIVADDKAPLTQLLRNDQRFQKVYEDKVAAVFVRR